MKVSLFVYTRTYYTDFHVLYEPKGHEKYLMEYTKLAEKLVSIYDIYKETHPNWVYLKIDNSILWGIICANSCLGDKSSDKESRPVRGFFGIVVDASVEREIQLPNNIVFFSNIYKQTVEQVWETRSYDSFELGLELDINATIDVIKEIDTLRTITNYIVMADIDEYYEFLGKRNNEKRKKYEAEIERLRKEEEREIKEKGTNEYLEKWKMEYNRCSSVEDFRRYAEEHAGEYDNPFLQKAKYNSCVNDSASDYGTQTDDDDVITIIFRYTLMVFMGMALLLILGGFKPPKQKPAPHPGFIYCPSCHGTGYEYNFLWGIISKKCIYCYGSGYGSHIIPLEPERKIDSTPFRRSESELYKGKKCGVVLSDGNFCRCSGCEPGNRDPFICTSCKHLSKNHTR